MEFDNDRVIRRPLGMEVIYWVAFTFIGWLVKGPTLVYLVEVLVLLPAFIWYADLWTPAYLFSRRYGWFALFSLAFFAAVLTLLWAVHPLLRVPFSWFRDCAYIGAQLLLAVAVADAKRATKEREEVIEVRKDNLFYKLRYLRAQMNPHFLFNTLNSIYSLSMQKSDRAPEMVVRLSDLMRYLLYECNEERIPLDKEITFIRNYIELEKVRYKADIRFTVEGNTQDVMVEPLLFIAFVENGFKHAMDNAFSEPFIYITLRVEETCIVLNVMNSTNADLETQAKRINGKGLTNSKSLLELLYPGSYKLDIIQTEREEARKSDLRIRHAKERLEKLYPDSFALDVLLNGNTFTVSLILNPRVS